MQHLAPTIGSTISHYEVLERLGSGGMGVVYRARDIRLERPVALKFLSAEISHDREAKTRFMQEARAASALDHPNICTIYEVDELADGRLFLAMACYRGESLKERIARGALPISEALTIVNQIALGLAESHARGIVHRDIKPANVWLTSSGQVKILDFGLAKVLGQHDLTKTGSSMGTPAYMAPESLHGEQVDPRADLWSLGVVLYEALTGVAPFRGQSVPTLIFSILGDTPAPLRVLRPEVPEEVEAIVGGLLRKSAAERYPSCQALLEDLARTRGEASGPLFASPLTAGNGAFEPPPGHRPSPSAVLREMAAEIEETLVCESPRPFAVSRFSRAEPQEPAPSASANATLASPSPSRMPLPDARHDDPFEEHLTSGFEAALARDYRQAAEFFERALTLRPGDPRATFNLERVKSRLN